MAGQLPDISTLLTLDDAAICAMSDLLFEPSPDIHDLAKPTARSRPFTSYPDFIDQMREYLLSLQEAVRHGYVIRRDLLDILGSHPRLGEKKVDSAQSRAEQANMQKGAGATEAERLAALNAEYEAKFPGLRYVVFVNGRGREEIMADMRARIDKGDIHAEEITIINAMCDIAKDRAAKLLSASSA